MMLYKYKSLKNFDTAVDVILNDRLYCSAWSKLNDPMEGVFSYSPSNNEKDVRRILNGIRSGKGKLKVCSLSEVANSMHAYLMWSHYGDEFKGIAFGFEFPKRWFPSVTPVSYVDGFVHIPEIENGMETQHARQILTSKMSCWEYEKEHRILSEDQFVSTRGYLQKVVLGHRAPKNLIESIKSICSDRGVNVYITGCGDTGVDHDAFDDWDYQLCRRVPN